MIFRDYIRDKKLKKNDRILEFGPLNWPIVTKQKYQNAFYADIRNSDDIKKLYTSNEYLESTGIKIDVDTIVDIDYVIKKNYKETFKNVAKFDAVILGHVIEHIPDILNFFIDVKNIIKHDGKLIIIYPDARYCFDSFRNGTSFIDAYDVFMNNENSSKRVFDFVYNVLHENDPTLFWNDNKQIKLLPKNSFSKALKAYEKAKLNELPDDTHFWPFADYQFIKFLYDMDRAGLLEFDIDEFYPTQHNTQEFMIILTPKINSDIKFDKYSTALNKTSPIIKQINSKNSYEKAMVEIAQLKEKNGLLNTEIHNLGDLINSKNMELDAIYSSKKWKYATNIGKVKNKISPKR